MLHMVQVKCHPEIAGEGVEYDWGCSKLDFRRTNLLVPKKFHTNVMASLATITRRKRIIFSRRARTYRRALTQLYNEGSCSFEKIINMVGTYKTHRNAVDFDSAFLKALGEGAVIAHPGTMAHHETYHQSILDVKRSQKEFAAHTVVSPSKGRDLKPVAINADREHGVVLKRQRLQDAAEWTTSVLKRMKLV
jgi:hypothetical protein